MNIVSQKKQSSRRALNRPEVRSRSKPVFLLAVQVFICLLLLLPHSMELVVDLGVKWVALFIVIHSLFVISSVSTLRFNSISSLYFVALAIFHFGFVIPYEFGFDVGSQVNATWLWWYNSSLTPIAIYLEIVGLASYTLGFLLVQIRKKSVYSNSEMNGHITTSKEFELSNSLSLLSMGMLVLGLLIWVVLLVAKGGFGIFFASYHDYQDIVTTTPLINYGYLFISLGMPILICTHPGSKYRFAGSMLFVVWSMLAFAMGLRGEVLFPAVTCIAILARQGVAVKLRYMVLAALVLLTLVSAVREVRQVGISNADLTTVFSGPVHGMVELGAQLRPVQVVVQWAAEGDELIYGASYWAPIERMLLRVFPFVDRISGLEDYRLMSVLINDRVGAVGFSPIAEAFYNFGIVGVFIILGLIGALFSRLDIQRSNLTSNFAIAIILMPFLMHVRNSFTPLPAQILVGIVLFYIAKLLANLGSRNKSHH